jgi:hypothetical protein
MGARDPNLRAHRELTVDLSFVEHPSDFLGGESVNRCVIDLEAVPPLTFWILFPN